MSSARSLQCDLSACHARQLIVKCNIHPECPARGELGRDTRHPQRMLTRDDRFWNYHSDECGYVTVVCPYDANVGQLPLLRKDLVAHRAACPRRPTPCPHCQAPVPFDELTAEGHLRDCPARPAACTNACGAEDLTREALLQHLGNDCPLQPVPCVFSEHGCTAWPTRNALEAHLTGNMTTHMRLVMHLNAQLTLQVQQLSTQFTSEVQHNAQLTLQVQQLNTQFTSEVQQLRSQVQQLTVQVAEQGRAVSVAPSGRSALVVLGAAAAAPAAPAASSADAVAGGLQIGIYSHHSFFRSRFPITSHFIACKNLSG